MDPRYLAAACAVLACASLYVLTPRPMALVQPLADEAASQAVEYTVDFDSLHAQATAAIEALQQSQERRVALAAAKAL